MPIHYLAELKDVIEALIEFQGLCGFGQRLLDSPALISGPEKTAAHVIDFRKVRVQFARAIQRRASLRRRARINMTPLAEVGQRQLGMGPGETGVDLNSSFEHFDRHLDLFHVREFAAHVVIPRFRMNWARCREQRALDREQRHSHRCRQRNRHFALQIDDVAEAAGAVGLPDLLRRRSPDQAGRDRHA